MNLSPAVIVAVPMAAAIVVFFWSLDRIRKERVVQPQTAPTARATLVSCPIHTSAGTKASI